MTEPGRRGRPRSKDADRSILFAAAEIIVEVGYEGLSIEAVAERAGVAKTTVYRRFASKPELVTAVARQLTLELPVPDTGSLRGDLVALVRSDMQALLSTFGPAIKALLGAILELPELREGPVQEFLDRRRRDVDVIMDRAVARGDIPPGADREMLQDLVVGALYFRFLVAGRPLSE